MDLILCIESATTNCAVAVFKDGDLIDSREEDGSYSHAEKLHPFIADLMKSNGLQFTDLSAIAVSAGPGSYTGLRIGVAAAKGLAYSLDKPLISIPTLRAMFAGVMSEPYKNELHDADLFCPMIDARRMEAFCAIYDRTGAEVLSAGPRVLDEHSFDDFLKDQTMLFFGNGSDKIKPMYAGHKNAHFLSGIIPSARHMGQLAQEKLLAGEIEAVAYYEPDYLKAFFATTPKKPI